MSMSIEHVNMKKYYQIDKVIINESEQFSFDIYGKNSKEEHVALLFGKGAKLIKDEVKNLIAHKFLYVYEKEKDFYEEYYRDFMDQKVIPKDMSSLYKDIGTTVNKMFENPEALGNAKEVEHIVTDMVTTILQDDFTVTSFISILAHDYYTHTHSLNVSVYALCLGKHIGMIKSDLEDLGTAALLHDLGKSRISKKIINKNGILTEQEFKEIKKHPVYGWALAKRLGIKNPKILAGIRNHHEKLDGSGYPDALKDEDIPLFAKIVGVCDVFDALTTKRSYKDPVSTFQTLLMMKKEMCNHLDGNIVDHFIKIFREENDL